MRAFTEFTDSLNCAAACLMASAKALTRSWSFAGSTSAAFGLRVRVAFGGVGAPLTLSIAGR